MSDIEIWLDIYRSLCRMYAGPNYHSIQTNLVENANYTFRSLMGRTPRLSETLSNPTSSVQDKGKMS